MPKPKLEYRIHNPNKITVTQNYILKILIEANKSKIDEEIKKALMLSK